MAGNVVRQIRIQGVSDGLKELERDTRAVGSAVEATARTTETSAKRQLSAAEAVRRLQMRMDEAFRSADQMAKAQATLDRAVEQSVIDLQQYNAMLAQARQRYDAATQAAQRDAQAADMLRAKIDPLGAAQGRLNAELAEYQRLADVGAINARELAAAQAMAKQQFDAATASLNRQNGVMAAANDNSSRFRRQNLTYQLFDVGQSLAGGINPGMIAAQQGPQIVQLYAGAGGVNAALRDTMGLLGGIAMRFAPLLAVAGAFALAVAGIRSEIESATGIAVSFGDVAWAMVQVPARAIYEELQPAINAISPWFTAAWEAIQTGARAAFNFVIASALNTANMIGAAAEMVSEAFRASYDTVQMVWAGLPAALGDIAFSTAQRVIGGIESMINGAIDLLNTFTRAVNVTVGATIAEIGALDFGELDNPYEGQAGATADAIADRWRQAEKAVVDAFQEMIEAGKEFHTTDFFERFFDAIAEQSVDNAKKRIAETKEEIKKAEEAARELRRQFDAFEGTADNLLDQYFPGEAARREAQELIGLLGRFGDQLDEMQRKAVNMRIDEMFVAASIGVRDLGNATDRTGDKIDDLKDKARDFAEEFRETVGQALHDVFTGGIKDLEDFARAFSGLAASNMQSFVDWAMGMGQFAPAKAPASVPRAQIVSFGEIIGAKVGESVANVISDGPIWERVGRGGGVAAAIQTGQAIARGITPALNQTFDSHLQAVMAGIKKIESSGNYGAIGPAHSRYGSPLGAYQIMEANLPQWSKQALGRFVSAGEFLKDAAMQDMIASKQMTRLFERFGNWDDVISAWHSGRPLSEAGSARDSLGTFTRDYVQKVNAAMGEVPDAVKVGATSGTQEGTQKGFIKLGQEVANAQPSQGGAQGGGFGNTAFGLLGAGLGGFSMGFQSANPLMGALGGAMQGWGAGAAFGMPIIGAVVGAIGGLIGGLLGARKRLKEAQRQLEMQIDEINNLIAVGEGKGLGKLQRRLAEYLTEVDKAVDLAWKARDMDLVERLQRSFNIYWARLEKDFAAGFEGLMNAYRSGRGEDDPFMQGFRAVEKLREEIREMIADVRYFGESRIELNPPELYDELKARMDREMEAATAAAIAMAMSFLAGAEEMTSMEQNVLSLQGAAAGLRATLQELGVSAEDTGLIIEQQFNAAMLKLQSEHIAEVSASIYDLADMGFINDLIGAQEQYNERLRDATILGLSADLANQELALSLRAIVTEADLTKEQITQLAAAFPALSSQLLGLAGLVGTGDTAKALADAEERKVEAENDLRRAYEQQASELENTISRLESFTESIKQFRDSLRVDNNLSPLNPFGRLTEAQKQFRETAALAMGGDEEAMGRLEDVSREYLDEARGYYASSEAYFAIFEEVQRILDQSLVSAEGQLTEAEKQLEQLKKQVGTLIDIDDGVRSVADAINAFRAAEAAVNAAEIADNAYKNTLFQQMIALLAQQAAADAAAKAAADAARPVYATNDPIANAYRTYLGHEPDAAGYAFWAGNLASGMMSIDQIIAEFRRVGGFASGGYTGDLGLNQVAGVVHGQEFVMNAMATERWRPQFEAINRGSWPLMGDNSAVVAELRELRQENARLSTAVQKLSQVVALSDEETRNVLREGNATQAENASTLRKVASR